MYDMINSEKGIQEFKLIVIRGAVTFEPSKIDKESMTENTSVIGTTTHLKICTVIIKNNTSFETITLLRLTSSFCPHVRQLFPELFP